MSGASTSAARRYGGQSAEQRRAERRARLLEAGLDLAGTAGWEQTTMTAVCGRARLTERYFYESFRNREHLLLTVLETVVEQIRMAVVAALRTEPDDPDAAVRAAVRAVVEVLVVDRRKARLVLVEAVAAPALRERRSALLHAFADRIVDQNRRLFGSVVRPSRAARIGAVVYVGGVVELFAAWFDGSLEATVDEIVDAGSALFVAAARA